MFNVEKARKSCIWKWMVQIFHWSLVLVLVVAYLTGDEGEDIHIFAGYTILGLLAFRFIWWIVGNRRKIYCDCSLSTKNVFKDIITFNINKIRYYLELYVTRILIIRALFVGLALAVITGIKVDELKKSNELLTKTTIVNSGIKSVNTNSNSEDNNFSPAKDKVGDSIWGELHEGAANFVLTLAILHMLGVISTKYSQKKSLP